MGGVGAVILIAAVVVIAVFAASRNAKRAQQPVKCPYCREPIQPDAIRCKHCHRDLE